MLFHAILITFGRVFQHITFCPHSDTLPLTWFHTHCVVRLHCITYCCYTFTALDSVVGFITFLHYYVVLHWLLYYSHLFSWFIYCYIVTFHIHYYSYIACYVDETTVVLIVTSFIVGCCYIIGCLPCPITVGVPLPIITLCTPCWVPLSQLWFCLWLFVDVSSYTWFPAVCRPATARYWLPHCRLQRPCRLLTPPLPHTVCCTVPRCHGTRTTRLRGSCAPHAYRLRYSATLQYRNTLRFTAGLRTRLLPGWRSATVYCGWRTLPPPQRVTCWPRWTHSGLPTLTAYIYAFTRVSGYALVDIPGLTAHTCYTRLISAIFWFGSLFRTRSAARRALTVHGLTALHFVAAFILFCAICSADYRLWSPWILFTDLHTTLYLPAGVRLHSVCSLPLFGYRLFVNRRITSGFCWIAGFYHRMLFLPQTITFTTTTLPYILHSTVVYLYCYRIRLLPLLFVTFAVLRSYVRTVWHFYWLRLCWILITLHCYIGYCCYCVIWLQ